MYSKLGAVHNMYDKLLDTYVMIPISFQVADSI